MAASRFLSRGEKKERPPPSRKLSNYLGTSTTIPDKTARDGEAEYDKARSGSEFSSETEDAGNYRDCSACGERLNVFPGNCVVSLSRKNKEEQQRTVGEIGREREEREESER